MLNEYQRNTVEEMDEVYKNVKALAAPVISQLGDVKLVSKVKIIQEDEQEEAPKEGNSRKKRRHGH
jgi:hypothetical protein